MGQKVLFLENVAAQAAGVREKLTEAGYDVTFARYEKEGRELAASWKPGIIVLSMITLRSPGSGDRRPRSPKVSRNASITGSGGSIPAKRAIRSRTSSFKSSYRTSR